MCGIYLNTTFVERPCPACEAEGALVELSKLEGPVFTPIIDYTYLAPQVVAVAQTRIEGTFKAYVDAVPASQNHEVCVKQVLERGTAVAEAVARCLFPRFNGLRYAR